jgi:hypothetical protein
MKARHLTPRSYRVGVGSAIGLQNDPHLQTGGPGLQTVKRVCKRPQCADRFAEDGGGLRQTWADSGESFGVVGNARNPVNYDGSPQWLPAHRGPDPARYHQLVSRVGRRTSPTTSCRSFARRILHASFVVPRRWDNASTARSTSFAGYPPDDERLHAHRFTRSNDGHRVVARPAVAHPAGQPQGRGIAGDGHGRRPSRPKKGARWCREVPKMVPEASRRTR